MGLRVRAEQPAAQRDAVPTRDPVSAPAGCAQMLAIQRSAGNQVANSLIDSSPPSGGAGVNALPVIGGPRKNAFTDRGRQLHLNDEQIEELWAIGSGHGASTFAPANERTGALFAAARSAASGGNPTYYISMKVEGLDKLNKAKGHAGADAAMETIRTRTLEELEPKFPGLEAVADRASGFGFIVAGDSASRTFRTRRRQSPRK